MLNKKTLILMFAISSVSICAANANLALSDLTAPKAPAYRVGISEIPENRYIEAAQDKENLIEKAVEKQVKANKSDSNDVNYSELSIKRISKEISQDLEYEEQDMVADLSLLWQGAATQSDTINFALYKLANPDADKPDKSTIKNMLKTIANMSTIAGIGSGNPVFAGASLIGSNVFGIMSQDTKALNYKYSKVTDADMIILIRKVEDLQQQTVDLYYDYMNAKKQLELSTKMAQERRERFELAQKNNVAREILVITDSYYRTAVDRQKSARAEFLAKRAALEQFVGNETFHQFEDELVKRENAENKEFVSSVQNEDYNKTVQNVENYTNSVKDNSAVQTPETSAAGEVQDNELLAVNTDKSKENVETAAEEKPKKEKKVKKDPHDLKGFIFIHDNQPDPANYEDTAAPQVQQQEEKTNSKKSRTKKDKKNSEQEVQPQPVQQKVEQKPKTEKFNGVELLPLDTIKTPDLRPNGYSIFSE